MDLSAAAWSLFACHHQDLHTGTDHQGLHLACRGHEVTLGENQKVTRQKKRRYNEINHVTSVSCSYSTSSMMGTSNFLCSRWPAEPSILVLC